MSLDRRRLQRSYLWKAEHRSIMTKTFELQLLKKKTILWIHVSLKPFSCSSFSLIRYLHASRSDHLASSLLSISTFTYSWKGCTGRDDIVFHFQSYPKKKHFPSSWDYNSCKSFMEYQLSVSWNEFEWLKVVIKNTFCGENFLLTLISNNSPCGCSCHQTQTWKVSWNWKRRVFR